MGANHLSALRMVFLTRQFDIQKNLLSVFIQSAEKLIYSSARRIVFLIIS